MMTVDDRAGSKLSGSFDFVRHLKRIGVPVKVRRMEFGDFAFKGHGPDGLVQVLIERKTTDEILTAFSDRRFVRKQLPGLLTTADVVFLVVEGKTWVDPRSGLLMIGGREAGRTKHRHLYENFVKFQLTLLLKANVRIWPTRSKSETVAFLHALYGWYHKRWADHRSAYAVDESRPDEAIFSRRTFKRQIAAQLPGVQWVRSLAADKYFCSQRNGQRVKAVTVAIGSIADMITATPLEWQDALGIKEGRKIATTLFHALNDPDTSDQEH